MICIGRRWVGDLNLEAVYVWFLSIVGRTTFFGVVVCTARWKPSPAQVGLVIGSMHTSCQLYVGRSLNNKGDRCGSDVQVGWDGVKWKEETAIGARRFRCVQTAFYFGEPRRWCPTNVYVGQVHFERQPIKRLVQN